jgi:hypothetical protein
MTHIGREQEKCVQVSPWVVLEDLWTRYREDEISRAKFEQQVLLIPHPFPTALRKTRRDFDLCLCGLPGDTILPFFEPFFIENFRATPRVRPEAQARVMEILNAYDQ